MHHLHKPQALCDDRPRLRARARLNGPGRWVSAVCPKHRELSEVVQRLPISLHTPYNMPSTISISYSSSRCFGPIAHACAMSRARARAQARVFVPKRREPTEVAQRLPISLDTSLLFNIAVNMVAYWLEQSWCRYRHPAVVSGIQVVSHR